MRLWNPCFRPLLSVFAILHSLIHLLHEFTMAKCQSINYLVFFFKAMIDLRKTKKKSSFKRKQYITAMIGKPTRLLVMGVNHKDTFILTIK